MSNQRSSGASPARAARELEDRRGFRTHSLSRLRPDRIDRLLCPQAALVRPTHACASPCCKAPRLTCAAGIVVGVACNIMWPPSGATPPIRCVIPISARTTRTVLPGSDDGAERATESSGSPTGHSPSSLAPSRGRPSWRLGDRLGAATPCQRHRKRRGGGARQQHRDRLGRATI